MAVPGFDGCPTLNVTRDASFQTRFLFSLQTMSSSEERLALLVSKCKSSSEFPSAWESYLAKFSCRMVGDVDAKVDSVAKLQAEFEAEVEAGSIRLSWLNIIRKALLLQLFDIDGLISALKACLRTPNQHLSTATLSAILPLLPLLIKHSSSPASTSSSSNLSSSVDSAILRQALNAFLPAGGVIERLGETREKAREKAREVLLAIGTVVFKASSSSPASTFRGKEAKGAESPLQIYERCLREQGLASKSWRVREQVCFCYSLNVHCVKTLPVYTDTGSTTT